MNSETEGSHLFRLSGRISAFKYENEGLVMKRTLTLALGVSVALLGISLNAAEVIVTTEKGTQTYWTGFGPSGQPIQAQTSSSSDSRTTFETGDANSSVR